MDNKRTVLNDAVRKLREAMGLTQGQFAEVLKVSKIAVARWETSRPPSEVPVLYSLKQQADSLLSAASNEDEQSQRFAISRVFHCALLQESRFALHLHSVNLTVKTMNILEMLLRKNPAIQEAAEEARLLIGSCQLLDGTILSLNANIDWQKIVLSFERLVEWEHFSGLAEVLAGADKLSAGPATKDKAAVSSASQKVRKPREKRHGTNFGSVTI